MNKRRGVAQKISVWMSRLNHAAAGAVLIFGMVSVSGAFAQSDDLEKPPEIPPAEAYEDVPIPPKVQDEQIEPTVTIREEEGERIEEYSYNGRVYMVKVTPSVGPPYYFIDSDGDGNLETAPTNEGLDPVKPVYWKIKEWN